MGRPRGCKPEEVVDRALDVFRSKGYEGTSVQDLVRGTGLTRFTLYECYGDKRRLFLAALDLYLSRIRQRATELFSKPGPRMPLLRQYLENLIQEGLQNPAKGCLMIHSIVELAPQDPECAACSSSHFASMEEIFMNLLAEARANGEFDTDLELRAVARFLLNTTRGIRTVSKITRDEIVMRDIVDVTMASLTNLSGKSIHPGKVPVAS